MERPLRRVAVTAFAIALSCCGGPGPEPAEVGIADHSDALTMTGGDNLFVLTITRTAKPYPLADVAIDGGLPGQTATVLNFMHNDTNRNGTVDAGDTLVVREPGVNLFDASTVGKAVNVSFSEKQGTVYYRIAAPTWTPAN